MTLKKYFIILITSILLIMIFLGLLGRSSTSDIIDMSLIRYEVAEVNAGMLMLRRNEKDFLMRKDLKYLDKFNNNHAKLVSRLSEVGNQLVAHGMSDESVQKMIKIVHEYGGLFRELVALQQKIGLHPKDGLYGSLRDAVHGVESLVKEAGDYRLLSDMLMLRRNEKDFMLRYDLKYLGKFNKNLEKFNANLADGDFDLDSRELIASKLEKYRVDFLAFVQASEQMGLSPKEGLRGKMRDTIHEMEQVVKQSSEELVTVAEDEISQDTIIMTVMGVIFTLLITGFLLLLARIIIAPIQQLSTVMQQSAGEHNLTLRSDYKGSCEIGTMATSFNNMMDEFQQLINEVINSANLVSSSAVQLTSAAQHALKMAQDQQGESEQVATAMNEMAATVQEVSQNAVRAADASTNADSETAKGATVVTRTIQGIQNLADEVEGTAVKITELKEESSNIGTVLSVITGIAEQTNLLALNAAIEAARAGEQGRGFAVVADEVRTLAQRSQESTTEIKEIIERLQSMAQQAVNAMESGREKARSTVEQAEDAGRSLDAINVAISQIRDMNTQIATAAEQQSAVAEEVNRSIVMIAQSAASSAENVDQVSQTSTELSVQSGQLLDSVKKFAS